VAQTGCVTVAERPLDPAAFPSAPAENLVLSSLVFARIAADARRPTSSRSSSCGAASRPCADRADRGKRRSLVEHALLETSEKRRRADGGQILHPRGLAADEDRRLIHEPDEPVIAQRVVASGGPVRGRVADAEAPEPGREAFLLRQVRG
jgi:hypothetical protein